MSLNEFFDVFVMLVGVPALVAMLTNLGKALRWVEDHQGQAVAKWLNLIAFVALFVVGQFVEFDLWRIDEIADLVAKLGVFALGLIPVGAEVAHRSHDAMAGLPVIGFQHSPE